MSYSRFSNSVWYTYWTVYSGDTKDTQRMAVHCSRRYDRILSYEYGMDPKIFMITAHATFPSATSAEREELYKLILRFREDVEESPSMWSNSEVWNSDILNSSEERYT